MLAPALPEAADSLAGTAVTAGGGGVYRIELGGCGQRLRTTTSVYVSPGPTGPLEVQVQTLSQVRYLRIGPLDA